MPCLTTRRPNIRSLPRYVRPVLACCPPQTFTHALPSLYQCCLQAKNRAVRNTRTIKACVVSCVALSCMADGLKEQLALRDSMCSTRTAQLRALRKRSAAQRVKSSALRAALTTQQQLTALAKSEMAVVREQALEREEKAKVLEETMASDQVRFIGVGTWGLASDVQNREGACS